MDAIASSNDLAASAPADEFTAAEAIGARVRQLRKEAGLTGTEFGERIGLSASKVSELEQGKYLCGLEVALKIEALSMRDGTPRIDAAELNEQVRAARAACPGGCD